MQINKAKKIVIKLGSSTIVDKKGSFKKKWLISLIKDIKKLKAFKEKVKKKYEIISVVTDKNLINLRKILLKNANK